MMFLSFFFCIYTEKNHVKEIKIFLKKKKKKGEKNAWNRYQSLSEEKKNERNKNLSEHGDIIWTRKWKEIWVFEKLLFSP